MAGVVPNLDRQITRRLAVMHRQLEKVYAATGTRSIKQLKEFIILGKERYPRQYFHFGWPSDDNGRSRSLILNHPEPYPVAEEQQSFRVQHVNGKDHLFATEKIISDWEYLNLILLQLEFPRQFIPVPIRAQLEAEHPPFSSIQSMINPRSDGRHWINSLPDDLYDEITWWLDDRKVDHDNWIDVEELFENANKLQQLREWKRGLQQGHAGRSPLLNLPEEGPANLVGTFVTGARRNGGLRPGLHNLHIAGQDIVLILRLLPRIPDVRGLRLPDAYRNRGHYVDAMRDHFRESQAHFDRIWGPAAGAGGPAAGAAGVGVVAAGAARTRKRKTRNRKTRKNRK